MITYILRILIFTICVQSSFAQDDLPLIDPENDLPQALDEQKTVMLIKAVDRGLSALHSGQKEDGSFPSLNYGQPGVTSLAIMAFLSRGHLPGEGPYGESLDKAIDYVLSYQKRSGLFATQDIDFARINHVFHGEAITAKTYNHAISMLMLGEVYGLTDQQDSFRIRSAIEKGLKLTIRLWDIRKPAPADEGGFRYTRPLSDRVEADISVTAWHATSLRSIRNAGFDIPQRVMDRIAAYIVRNQNRDGGFGYSSSRSSSTYVMTAAGTLCLALAGKSASAETQRAARYLAGIHHKGRSAFQSTGRYWPYYSCYYLTQSSIQLGGQVWVTCMGKCAAYLLPRQQPGGLWPPDGQAARFGSAYSTSMAIIALTPTLQILPIYQR